MPYARREFLSVSGAAAVGWLGAGLGAPMRPGARLVGTLPLGSAARPAVPADTLLGSGLDARQFTDLSTLTPDSLITSNARFFTRTEAPPGLADRRPWRIRVGGLVREPQDIELEPLEDLVRPMGAHLLECAGNAEPFGLMSAAEWSGIPLTTMLDRVAAARGATRVLVSGMDDVTRPWQTSLAGASWVFSLEELVRTGAFLATRMNGDPLPPNHGHPVRLVVPGWYGCASIEWVIGLELLDETAATTTQMREFSARTHQQGVPELARDFSSPVIDTAAMPIRIEKWVDEGRLFYRVVGVIWGGPTPTKALVIRFKHTQPFVRVDDGPLPRSTTTWTTWTHQWRPDAPGRYDLVLRLEDTSIRARRLDLNFYTRSVVIDDV